MTQINDKNLSIALASSAHTHRSEHYPLEYGNTIPLKIRMNCTVSSIFILGSDKKAYAGQEYYVSCNSHGAIAAILESGGTLGVKPSECEIIEWIEIPNEPYDTFLRRFSNNNHEAQRIIDDFKRDLNLQVGHKYKVKVGTDAPFEGFFKAITLHPISDNIFWLVSFSKVKKDGTPSVYLHTTYIHRITNIEKI